MFSKNGSTNKEPSQLSTVSVDHFFECVKKEKVEDLRNYFRDPNYKVWQLKEENDYTALHRAVFNNSEKITSLIIEELKKRIGFESKVALANFINEKTNEGITALHYAAYKGNITIAKLLIENGAIVEMVTNRGKNVMHLAAEGNQPSMMYYFISYHAQDIFSIDDYGSTPLHWACYSGSEESVLFLISLKANINAKDKEGITPLNLAVSSKREKIVLILLQRGADKTIENIKKETPLSIAIKKNYYEIINLLKEKDYNPICTLETPIEYIPPENMYKKFIFGFMLIPQIILIFSVLPYLEGYIEAIVNGSFFILALISYIFLLFKEPGVMRNEELLKEAVGGSPLKTLIDKNYDLKHYCPTCYIRKSKIGKHCFLCDKCIEGFEHHCFWLNKCIGKRNVHLYFIFLLFTLVYAFTCIYVSILCMTSDINIPEGFWTYITIGKDNQSFKILASGFVFIVAAFFSCPLFFLTMIQILSWIKVLSKKNTIEHKEKKRKEALEKEKGEKEAKGGKEDLEISLLDMGEDSDEEKKELMEDKIINNEDEEDNDDLNINRVSGGKNDKESNLHEIEEEKDHNIIEVNQNNEEETPINHVPVNHVVDVIDNKYEEDKEEENSNKEENEEEPIQKYKEDEEKSEDEQSQEDEHPIKNEEEHPISGKGSDDDKLSNNEEHNEEEQPQNDDEHQEEENEHIEEDPPKEEDAEPQEEEHQEGDSIEGQEEGEQGQEEDHQEEENQEEGHPEEENQEVENKEEQEEDQPKEEEEIPQEEEHNQDAISHGIEENNEKPEDDNNNENNEEEDDNEKLNE